MSEHDASTQPPPQTWTQEAPMGLVLLGAAGFGCLVVVLTAWAFCLVGQPVLVGSLGHGVVVLGVYAVVGYLCRHWLPGPQEKP